MFVGFFFLIVSGFMLYGSTKVSVTLLLRFSSLKELEFGPLLGNFSEFYPPLISRPVKRFCCVALFGDDLNWKRKCEDRYQRRRIPWLFFQATEKLYRHQWLSFQRMAHHIFPYLIGILLSTAWSTMLGVIEVFDSDMGLAMGYFVFAGNLINAANCCRK